MEALLDSFTMYYGLDWLAMVCGLWGTYLISKKSKWAFAAWIVMGLTSIFIAVISMQFGILAYHVIGIILYAKSLQCWTQDERQELARATAS